MSVLDLKKKRFAPRAGAPMTEEGRRYAEKLASETFGLPREELTATAIRELPKRRDLLHRVYTGPWGEVHTGIPQWMTEEELAEAAARAEAFLKDASPNGDSR